MTLASQNIRTQSRNRHMSSSRKFVSPKLVGGAIAGAVLVMTGWWLLKSPATPDNAQGQADSAAALTPSGASRGMSSEAPPALPSPRESGGAGPSREKRSNDAGAIVMGSHVESVGGGTGTRETGRESGAEAIDRATRDVSDGARTALGQGRETAPAPQANQSQGSPPGSTNPTPPSAPPTTPPSTSPPKAPAGTDATPPTGPAKDPKAGDSPATPPPAFASTTSVEFAQALQLQQSDPVKARLLVTRALDGATLTRAERDRAYDLVNALGKSLFFNANVNPNDPTMAVYAVKSGDSLQKIVRSEQLGCDYRLLQRLNGLTDPNKLRLNQRLRVPKGDFHGEVLKNEYRLNIYLGEGSDRVMVQSFRVGLGESNGTPLGLFKVRANSKLVDPQWTHPRTGQHFAANDPLNPIGEHWIGLVGVEDRNREFLGYGIHGTIEPDSIGKDRSLGCVRLLADDVAIVYECLTEPDSTVLIK